MTEGPGIASSSRPRERHTVPDIWQSPALIVRDPSQAPAPREWRIGICPRPARMLGRERPDRTGTDDPECHGPAARNRDRAPAHHAAPPAAAAALACLDAPALDASP